MPIMDESTQQQLLHIAEIASRRQAMLDKCRNIEKSDFKCTMHGVERLRHYRRELDKIEQELEAAVKEWDSSVLIPSQRALP
jgi:hypothetical protein